MCDQSTYSLYTGICRDYTEIEIFVSINISHVYEMSEKTWTSVNKHDLEDFKSLKWIPENKLKVIRSIKRHDPKTEFDDIAYESELEEVKYLYWDKYGWELSMLSPTPNMYNKFSTFSYDKHMVEVHFKNMTPNKRFIKVTITTTKGNYSEYNQPLRTYKDIVFESETSLSESERETSYYSRFRTWIIGEE